MRARVDVSRLKRSRLMRTTIASQSASVVESTLRSRWASVCSSKSSPRGVPRVSAVAPERSHARSAAARTRVEVGSRPCDLQRRRRSAKAMEVGRSWEIVGDRGSSWELVGAHTCVIQKSACWRSMCAAAALTSAPCAASRHASTRRCSCMPMSVSRRQYCQSELRRTAW